MNENSNIPEKPNETELDKAIQMINTLIKQMHKNVERLEGKMTPVLSSSELNPDKDDRPKTDINTMRGNQLIEIYRELSIIQGQLADLFVRFEG